MRQQRKLFALGSFLLLCSCRTSQPCPPAIASQSFTEAKTVSIQEVLSKQNELLDEKLFDRLENPQLFKKLKAADRVNDQQLRLRLSEETILRTSVEKSRKIAQAKQGPTPDSRQYVIDFTESLKPDIEKQMGKLIGSVTIDMSDLAKPMYDNLATMIQKHLEEVSNYRGDHLAAIPRVEAVSLSPRGEQCTGIIIARNAIATASHCALYGPTFVHIGDTATDSANAVPIEPSHFQYVTEHGKDLDMAVIVQPEPIDGIDDKDLPRFATDAMIASATELIIVGFGGYFTDSTEAGFKRLGRVPMLSADCGRPGEEAEFGCHKGFDMVAGSRALLDRPTCPASDELDIPNGACSGDSGGPVYVQDKEGNLYLAGLISSTVDPKHCGCSAATNVYVRFDKQIAFLRDLGVHFLPQALTASNSIPDSPQEHPSMTGTPGGG